jgi:hypothetical protein
MIIMTNQIPLRTRENDKYRIQYTMVIGEWGIVDAYRVNVYRKHRVRGPKLLNSASIERKTRGAAIRQYRRRIAKYIIGQEKWNQLVDEIGGFLGNRDWKGDLKLADMAMDPELRQWASHFGALPNDIFWALKTIQKEDGVLQDFEDGMLG